MYGRADVRSLFLSSSSFPKSNETWKKKEINNRGIKDEPTCRKLPYCCVFLVIGPQQKVSGK